MARGRRGKEGRLADQTTSVAAYQQIDLPLLPLGPLAALTLVLLVAAVLIGFLTGASQRRKTIALGGDVDPRIGETTVGALLAILGLLLAFSFGNALSVSGSIKTALIDEAAALGTVFLRADYLPEPGSTEMKQAILDYAKTRPVPEGGVMKSRNQAEEFITTTLTAQARLWPLTLQHASDPVPVPVQTFFASAMNEALDAHLYRMRSLSEPVSYVTQLMVLGAALAALFLVANRAGSMGRTLSWRTFLLSGFLFDLMIIILDIGRAAEGLVVVDDSALRATIAEMEAALAP